LRAADLSKANLQKAKLYKVDLLRVNPVYAGLRISQKQEADLRGAILCFADLQGTHVLDDQLRQARSLQGASPSPGKNRAPTVQDR